MQALYQLSCQIFLSGHIYMPERQNLGLSECQDRPMVGKRIRVKSMRPPLPLAATRAAAIAAVTLISACGSYNGSWPRLGPTAQDAASVMESAEETATSAAAQSANTAQPGDTAATQTIRTRLAQVAASFADTQDRAQRQRRAVINALDKAGSITGSSWSLAQLELSRLNQIDAELISLREEAAGIAGDLAALSAKGLPVTALVGQTGTLINTISQEISSVEKTRDSARATLAT
jgi:hypothetical protein